MMPMKSGLSKIRKISVVKIVTQKYSEMQMHLMKMISEKPL